MELHRLADIKYHRKQLIININANDEFSSHNIFHKLIYKYFDEEVKCQDNWTDKKNIYVKYIFKNIEFYDKAVKLIKSIKITCCYD